MQRQKSVKSSGPSQPRGRRKNDSSKKGVVVGQRTTAVAYAPRFKGIGINSNHRLVISWLAGYVAVGNGTLGVTDSVYYQNVGGTFNYTVGSVPVLPSDPNVGATYVADMLKYYARSRYHRLKAKIIALNPSTTNSMVTVIGPVRGEGSSIQLSSSSGLGAALTLANVVAVTGEKPIASYENREIDLTPFIAGGSGAKQNEFAGQRNAASTGITGGVDLTGVTPCGLLVAGNNSTTALRGTRTHMIVIEADMEFLDFMGGVSQTYPALVSVLEPIAREDPKRFATLVRAALGSRWNSEHDHLVEALISESSSVQKTCC